MRESAVAVGGTALALICCAAGPLALGAVGGITIAVLLGWGALLVAVVAVAALVIGRRRRATDRRDPR
jgi:hypothetical protein